MANRTYVLNKSTMKVEEAEQNTCPHCKGIGSNRGEGECHLCKGYGYLWTAISGSGWTRTYYSPIKNSQLY